MNKLTEYELLEGIDILFDTGYLNTRGLAQIDDCIYTKDDLEQIRDYFYKLLESKNYHQLRKKELNKNK
jgi:hypothetical protein|tara:strand:+ start:438 stop:644 length:207 start_codon:yes stop_codon:yes gene_type:complete